MATIDMRRQLRSRLTDWREQLIRDLEESVGTRSDTDMLNALTQIKLLNEFLKEPRKTGWRKQRTPLVVATLCFVSIGLGWTVSIDKLGLQTDVILHVETEAASFRIVEEVNKLLSSVSVQGQELQIENAAFDFSGSLPFPASAHDEASLFIDKGQKSLNNLSVAGGSFLEIESTYQDDRISISIKGPNTSGKVLVENNIDMEVLDSHDTRPLKGYRLDDPEYISFEARGRTLKPTRILFSPERPLTIANISVSDLAFDREVSRTDDDRPFVSAIRSGTIDLPEVDNTISLLHGEAVSFEDVTGDLRSLSIGKTIAVSFEGRASRISSGLIDKLNDRTPTLLAYLYHNEQIAFLLATASFVWGALWSLARLLGV